jgi:hypothetical protein
MGEGYRKNKTNKNIKKKVKIKVNMFNILNILKPISFLSLILLDYTKANDYLFIDRFSYCKENEIKTFTCEDCTSSRSLIGVYDPLSKASSQVVVVTDKEEDQILVGFRGTINKIQQWASNLDAVYTRWSVGKVHSGFYDRFNEIKIPTLSFLKKARQHLPDADIIISGHSMGGAVATLFASYLKDGEDTSLYPSEIYTYGSPRVGDKTFATYVDTQFGDHLTRTMNEWDMVTDLPPKAFGYRHTGKLVVCKTGTDKCKQRSRLEENPGGIRTALKRTIETAKNVKLCHLTYMDETIGTNRYKCI